MDSKSDKRIHLGRESGGRCELLFAIHPAFVGALPAASSSSSIQENNYITLLRHEISMMTMIFNPECTEQYLSEDAFCACTESLDSILILFEDLIAGTISVGVDHSRDKLHTEFPKLVALKGHISSGDKFAYRWISFGKKPTQHNATLVAKSFNQNMSKLLSNTKSGLDVSDSPGFDENIEADVATLQKTEQLSGVLGRLFEQLKERMCLKNPEGHKARVRLSEFAEYELEIMISICGNQRLWQQVNLSMRHLNNCDTQGAWIEDICSELTRSYRIKKILTMDYNEKGLCKGSATRALSKGLAILPTETLREILQKEEELRRGKVSHYRSIKKKDKRKLGLLLSTSFVHFYGSPLLQSPWSANTIYIRQPKGDIVGQNPTPEAYMACAFDSGPMEQLCTVDDPVPGDPFVLALAALLIELELEQEVTVLDEDIDDITGEKSLYMAVTRFLGDLDEYLEDMDPFPGIIDSCLQIYTEIYDTDRKDYHRTLRKEIFTKVIYPLSQRDRTISKPWKSLRRSNAIISQDNPSHTTCNSALSPAPLIEACHQPMVHITEMRRDEEEIIIHPLINPLPSPMEISDPLLLSSRGSISSSKHWLKEFDRINKSLKDLRSQSQVSQRIGNVRIAILDTGCDLAAPCIASMPGAAARLVGHWQDFQENSKQPIDEDAKQHGTALTALLLRVAFHVDIFIGRVAKNQEGLSQSIKNISTAIHYAATEWKADIITMSFGFPFIAREIENAVADVNRGRRDNGKSEIVCFAAANNDGSNSEEMFPASLETVISVRGTDHTGAFINKFNPKPRPRKIGSLLYGTLGHNVPYDMGNTDLQISGCSIATPILAGIVATIMQYVNYTVGLDAETRTRLQTKEGVLQVLEHISEKEDSGNRRYVAPWIFFRWNEAERSAAIVYALSKLERHV